MVSRPRHMVPLCDVITVTQTPARDGSGEDGAPAVNRTAIIVSRAYTRFPFSGSSPAWRRSLDGCCCGCASLMPETVCANTPAGPAPAPARGRRAGGGQPYKGQTGSFHAAAAFCASQTRRGVGRPASWAKERRLRTRSRWWCGSTMAGCRFIAPADFQRRHIRAARFRREWPVEHMRRGNIVEVGDYAVRRQPRVHLEPGEPRRKQPPTLHRPPPHQPTPRSVLVADTP